MVSNSSGEAKWEIPFWVQIMHPVHLSFVHPVPTIFSKYEAVETSNLVET